MKSLAAMLALTAPIALGQVSDSNFVGGPAVVQSSESDILARLAALEAAQSSSHGYVVMEEEEDTYPGGFFAGFEAVAAKPYFEGATAFQDFSGNITSFNPEFFLSPRIYFGYQSESGAGLQATYWQFDQQLQQLSRSSGIASVYSSVGTLPIRLQTFNPLTSTTWLDAETLDFDAFSTHTLGRFELRPFAGVRYTKLSQAFEAVSGNADGNDVLRHQMNFDGLGPTVGIRTRALLAQNFYATGGTRMGIAYGQNREYITSQNVASNGSTIVPQIVDDGFGSVTFASANSSRKATEMLSVIAFQVGVEWNYELESGSLLYVNSGVECQLWTNAGNLSSDVNSMSFLGLSVGGGIML